MTPELAFKVDLLLKSASFREDLEKVASELKLNPEQQQEVVLRTASAMDFQNIIKEAARLPLGPIAEAAPGALSGAKAMLMKALPWLGGGAGVFGTGYGAGRMGAPDISDQKDQISIEAAKKAISEHGNAAGTGVGGLAGGVLGAGIGNKLTDGGTLGTGLGAGLGAGGGALLGSYLQDQMSMPKSI